MRHVIAIDQGTTGSTVLVMDEELRVRGRCTEEFRQIYPRPGWVEHDPDAIWQSVLTALGRALAEARIDTQSIAAIGITNQRETAVLWERRTLEPVRNAIVWQDRRTSDRCAELERAGHGPRIRELTGLVIDPYFSATKLEWMLREDAERSRRAGAGEIAFGTIDSYLVAKLTAGEAFITDVTNASRTLLFDLRALDYSPELLELFGVPREMLPEVASSAEVYGETRGVPMLPDGIPVAGIAGDQQAALFGQACFTPGSAKVTYGTGAFVLENIGDEPVLSDSGLLTTVAWRIGEGSEKGELRYAVEGSAFIAGAAVQWLRDGLGIITTAPEVEKLAAQVEDSGGVIVLPGFAGLGAPHWRPEARGLISGLTRGTTAAHIARATLEGIALQITDILHAMERDTGRALAELRVDGGAAANDLLMQFQADVLGVTISRPEILETTALGSALLAGLATGVWRTKADIARTWREERRFEPGGDRAKIEEHLERWRRAVSIA
jgi:glycerol kinase